MIALAVADSPLARELLAQNQLQVDRLEVHGPHAEEARAAFPGQPFLLHNSVYNWTLSAPDALSPEIIKRTLHVLRVTGAPWLSAHLGFSAERIGFDGSALPRSPTLDRGPLQRRLSATILALKEALPVPLLLENLDYVPNGAYRHICEPQYIGEVLEAADTAMLLDLAHARVSASYLEIPIETYLAALPLQRVRQIHISGPRPQGNRLQDAHAPLLDEDVRLLQWTLERTEAWALTLEYRKTEAALLEQLDRLRQILRRSKDSA